MAGVEVPPSLEVPLGWRWLADKLDKSLPIKLIAVAVQKVVTPIFIWKPPGVMASSVTSLVVQYYIVYAHYVQAVPRCHTNQVELYTDLL